MAALIQTRNTCSFFQNPAAIFGFRVDQFRDLTLTDQRWRVRSCRGIREQHLHVARAHILASRLVGAADVTRNAAHDFKRVHVVEPRRCKAFGVVDVQRHFGKVAGGAGRSACKNHVFHAATAHRSRAVFAHDPAQRFEQIRFATAVGTHNAGQTICDDQIRGVHKAFKARQSEFRKAQWRLIC